MLEAKREITQAHIYNIIIHTQYTFIISNDNYLFIIIMTIMLFI